jgi:hypothetical protein
MKNKLLWISGHFAVGLLIFTMLFITGCQGSDNNRNPFANNTEYTDEGNDSNAGNLLGLVGLLNGIVTNTDIATTSTIGYGTINPEVTVTGTNFKDSIEASDLTVDVGSTGLTLSTVNYVTATQIQIAFTGTALPGNVSIQAKTSAFNPLVLSESNTLIINVHLAIGDSYGGGIVAYVFVEGDPGYDADIQHGLIAATVDQGIIVWHTTNNGATGATAQELGTGNANTNTILSVYGTENNAAKLCADYSVSVGLVIYNDWYLPSWIELNKLYAMKVLGFGVGGLGASSRPYWSSSEYNDGSALSQDLTNGNLWIQGKNALDSVRCVRSF